MAQLAAFVVCELLEASETLASLGEARSERVRRSYFEVARNAIAATDGTELDTVGDRVSVAFGSVRGALTFADLVQRGCDRESRRSSERLDVRVGIDVGEASSDDLSEAGAATAAERALQLARSAGSGSVLVTDIVNALAADLDARLTPAGLLELPGSREPVRAYEARWERPIVAQSPLPPELDEVGPQTPFVGRATERNRLQGTWRSALAGERQLALVAGEPGIGKTRLVAEFARSLHQEGATVLWGRSSEEALSPYQPFVQALRHHVLDVPREELREQVGTGAELLARLLPELRPRLSLPAREAADDFEGERYQLFEAIGRLLAAASTERPLLLVLDDLQWADPGTLFLLKHVARDSMPARLMILGTYRHSEVGRGHPLALVQADVERDRVVERIELSGLAESEVATLVGGLMGGDLPAGVARSLRGETEGNPFFLEEVVRHLEELGLGTDAQRLASSGTAVRELGVPARVRELVGRRVQRLSPSTREVLFAAAVVGSELDSDVLAEALEGTSPPELNEALDEAVEARLLDESAQRIGHYAFTHTLVQQALYEEQTVNRRARLHEQVAAALERLRPHAVDLDAELAYHYARAGDRFAARVVRHGRAAGEHALALFAYEDAVRALAAALAALERARADDSAERAELLVRLGSAHASGGDYPLARTAFHEAAELSAATGAWRTLAQAALGYGGGTSFGGIWETHWTVNPELVRLLERALAACPAGDSRERVRLLGRLAQALYWTPETERARQLSDEAIAIARRLGDPTALAYALDSRHVVLFRPQYLDEGRALGEEMLAHGRALGDHDIQLEALSWLITDALKRGSVDVVDELTAEHARIATELRQPYHLWFADVLRAMRAHLAGRLTEAEELHDRAYSHGEHAYGRQALQVHLVQGLFLRLDQGRAAEALAEIEAHSSAWPSTIRRAGTALALAGLDRREKALEQVASLAEQGLASLPQDAIWMPTMVMLGRAVAHFDDSTWADELYELLVPYADRICVTGGPALCLGPVSRILGMLARAAGRPEAALEHFDDALDRSRSLGSPPLVARTQLEAAKAHLRRSADGDLAAATRLLDEAHEIARELGMEKLLRDVEALQASLEHTVSA